MARTNGSQTSVGQPGRRLAYLVVLGLAGWGMPAFAQTTYPPEVENQCRDDYFRFCSPYSLGTDQLRRCMESKGKSLSPNCQQALKDAGFVKPDRVRRGG